MSIIHGNSKRGLITPIYNSWAHMKSRCLNPNNKKYKNYGGRGIKICDRWMKFENFLEDMKATWKKGLSLDRIDNNGNYCKENCRWATPREQANNTRSNRLIAYNNETLSIAEWSKKFNLNQMTLLHRITPLNWSIEKALTYPIRKKVEITE